MRTGHRSLALMVALLFGSAMSIFPQGSIVPTTPPNVPIMKTLDELEPRTRIPGGTTAYIIPVTGSGSYYLSGNLSVASGTAITVNGSNVTIDLGGFELAGTGGSTGILIGSGQSNVTIRNGTIRNFTGAGINGAGRSKIRVSDVRALGNGLGIRVDVNGEVVNCVAEANGTGILGASNAIVRNCIAASNTSNGISVGASSLVADCITASNSTRGIFAGASSEVVNCSASANGYIGIETGDNSVIKGARASGSGFTGITAGNSCVVRACTSTGSAGAGFVTGTNSALSDCTASTNQGSGIVVGNHSVVTHCASEGNGGLWGFSVSSGSKVEGCVAAGNTDAGGGGFYGANECNFSQCDAHANAGFGIRSENKNRLVENSVTGNGVGISASGTGNLIDGNHVRNNTGNGIQVPTATGKNVIIRNEAGDNGGSYTGIAAGNQMAPTGDPTTSTNPFLNIAN